MKATSIGFIFASCLFPIATGTSVDAQEVKVQVATEEAPHYVGVPMVVQLTVEGLEPRPEPECTVETSSPDVRARLAGMSPRIVQRMFQSGNTIRRVQEVTYTIQFRVVSSKPGEQTIGPFKISQNGIEKQVDAIKLSFQEVPTTDDMRVKLIMPDTAYPDQRVPVTIQWWFAGNVRDVNELNIDASSLDEFQFSPDAKPGRGESTLPIQTEEGVVPLSASATRETVDEKEFTVVTAERTLIPNRPGQYSLAPLTATIEMVTEWQQRRRSFGGFGGSLLEEAFGDGRRPAKIELFRAVGEPFEFEVKPFPTRGRPESFAGAVGKGYSLEVAADRTVVRVGDPIRLTLNLRGDGNLKGATLPPLSADGGLDPSRFRLPEGDVAGAFQDDQDAKQFVVSVRVLDESVNEIPAIAYSWFDADKETYLTSRSKPIALRVMPAKVVGADAVVTNQPDPLAMDSTVNTESQQPAAQPRSYSLSGADLAIEKDPVALLADSTGVLGSGAFQIAGYAFGSLCVLVALVDRRRRQIDPAVREANAILRTQRGRISDAARLPEKEAAKQIAEALRTVVAAWPESDGSEIRSLIARCEVISYKPGNESEGSISSELIDQSIEALSRFDLKLGES